MPSGAFAQALRTDALVRADAGFHAEFIALENGRLGCVALGFLRARAFLVLDPRSCVLAFDELSDDVFDYVRVD